VADKWEGQGMVSADGEYVEFSSVVALEGPVEDWLCVVGMMNCDIYIYTLMNNKKCCLLTMVVKIGKTFTYD